MTKYGGQPLYTFIAHLPACKECFNKYREEGMQGGSMVDRMFFRAFIEKARKKGIKQAVDYTFYGY